MARKDRPDAAGLLIGLVPGALILGEPLTGRVIPAGILVAAVIGPVNRHG